MQPVWANKVHAASGLQTKRQLFLRTDALAVGSGWDDLSSIVWLILTAAIGGPILITWVVAGFQKSAV
jgi:hypothetical protein